MKNSFAVIFDMDGVLVDNRDFHYRTWMLFCRKHNIEITEEQFLKVFGGSSRENLENLLGKKLSDTEVAAYSDEKEQMYRELYRPHLKPVKGLKNFLDKLKNSGIDMAIATSAPLANAEFVIEEAGLQGYFNLVVHEAMLKHNKPHPEVYLKTAGILGYKPAQCFAFEDSPKGIESAYRAGMKVIGVATTFPAEKIRNTDYIIKNFTEIDPEKLYVLFKQ